jgi:transcriptional regulator with XRE-family HTH domain
MKTNEIRGRIVAKGLTQAQFAKMLGMSPKTFYLRMKKGVFGSDHMAKMIELLDLDNPSEIFFEQKVTR